MCLTVANCREMLYRDIHIHVRNAHLRAALRQNTKNFAGQVVERVACTCPSVMHMLACFSQCLESCPTT